VSNKIFHRKIASTPTQKEPPFLRNLSTNIGYCRNPEVMFYKKNIKDVGYTEYYCQKKLDHHPR
jgi:hypothetical protein